MLNTYCFQSIQFQGGNNVEEAKLNFGKYFFILLLTACNDKAAPLSTNSRENAKAKETMNGESELTAKEVYEKMVEASSEVKSLGLKMNIAQDISTELDEVVMTTETKSDSKMILEPISLYQKIEVNYKNPALGEQKAKFDQYLTDEGFFMYDSEGDSWSKYNADYATVAKQLNLQQGTNQWDSLKQLNMFVDDFTFEQDANQFILTFTGNDKKMNELIKESLTTNIPQIEEAFKSMNIQGVEYDIFIDKKTFLPSAMNVDMHINISENGNTLILEQSVESNYYDYNNIDKIILPKEALDSPQEINLADPTSL